MQSTVPYGIVLEDLIDLTCAAWKVRRQVANRVAGEPSEAHPFSAHITAICDSLSQCGIEIQDHTGQAFDSAQAVEVLAFESTPNIPRPTITDTLRPTVYWQGNKVLSGLVVVAVPTEVRASAPYLQSIAHQ